MIIRRFAADACGSSFFDPHRQPRMSSQPNRKTPEIQDGFAKELHTQGLPLDVHLELNVHTTRVRLNPDGTRTVLSEVNSSSSGRRVTSSGRPSKLVAIILAALGFIQLSYGVWTAHSDAQAASIMHASESCQLQRLMTPSSLPAPSSAESCAVEKAIVVNAYASSSRHGTTYHVVTLRPDGAHDDTRLTARGAYQFWKRLRPTELITAQRLVAPGYRLTGEVLALADSEGTAMSRDHPDSGAYPNAVAILMGSLLFAVAIAMFASAGRKAKPIRAVPGHAESSPAGTR